ncbi:hypothetical protein [Nocardia salmonicida]|uniref:hypothetical protein n=1 Tax=Nocardia salmonicida TaxID=53431 RepID=UPI0034188DF4
MTPRVDQALQDWASKATDTELDAGPSLADLGGVDAVLAEAEQLAAGPMLPYFLTVVGRDLHDIGSEQMRRLLDAAAKGLREPQAAWVLADAIDVLCDQPLLVNHLGNRTVRDLAGHAESALAGEADAALAQPAIAGLLRFALAEMTSPHRLLSILTDITGEEPCAALERLPVLIGVAHDHFGDQSLLNVLSMVENRTDLAHTTRADASFELAVADVRAALEATEHSAVDEYLRRASMRFKEIDRTQEARLDARAHAAAIDAVLAFSENDRPTMGLTPVAQRLNEASIQLEAAASTLAAWTCGMHQLNWLSARGLAQAAWSRLAASLHAVRAHLDQPSWYDPAGTLNEILNVYVASRSVHVSTADGPAGLTALISPPIEAAFVRHEGLLCHLEQALTTDSQFVDSPDARSLLTAVQVRRQSALLAEQVVPGKVFTHRPNLAAIFSIDGQALRDDLDPQFLDTIEQMLEQQAKGYTPTGNAHFDEHIRSLLATLGNSPAWKARNSEYFTTMLEQFLRFLYDRFDAQADLYGERTAYLGPAPKGQMAHPVAGLRNTCRTTSTSTSRAHLRPAPSSANSSMSPAAEPMSPTLQSLAAASLPR